MIGTKPVAEAADFSRLRVGEVVEERCISIEAFG